VSAAILQPHMLIEVKLNIVVRYTFLRVQGATVRESVAVMDHVDLLSSAVKFTVLIRFYSGTK
jgi:hypothetical protein